ncbi:MAG: demethoxyubiquinone hydroxylase family protein [Magnetovibrio sp.]|nr:demethoxyubiquinone hydroxylase family protein [Magnetovibrio sp.]|tara:strand:- start:2481 stop:3059 length:579 start_codon:yes stop_codon:yes gene_type:complete
MSEKRKKYSSKAGLLPGDLSQEQLVERMIRVDHAGEYGAVRIYQGQLSVMGHSESSSIIKHMLDQEIEHFETFSEIIKNRRVRPTALMPLWHFAGFALGAGTALMGKRAAMACTVAVEEVIDEHYASQVEKLESMGNKESNLRDVCKKFRSEEIEHKNIGLEHDAEKTPGFETLSALVKTGSRVAIWLSERL